MMRKTNKKMADQWLMILSGLAVLGNLIFIAWARSGSFTGDSVFLDFVGLMLFRAAYREYRGPMWETGPIPLFQARSFESRSLKGVGGFK
jgi:hypothetical protein